jgi:hypothetical protein
MIRGGIFMKRKPMFALGFAFLLSGVHANGQVVVGMSVCNQRFDRDWILSTAPGIGITRKYFRIGLDGSWAAYTSKQDPRKYFFQNRVSLVPMVKVPFKSLHAALGYGVSKTFQREETSLADGTMRASTVETIQGELRANLGLALPVSEAASLVFSAGYAHQTKSTAFWFASVGVELRVAKRRDPFSSVSLPETVLPDSLEIPPTVRTVSLIGGQDLVADEVKAAIEATLIRSGIRVISWDRIRTEVSERITAQIKPTSSRSLLSFDPLDSLSNEEIAFRGTKTIPLDAVIEPMIRYAYEAYGEDVAVQSAFVRVIDPYSGAVLWANPYDLEDPSFARFKARLIQDLVRVIRRIQPATHLKP